MPNRHLHHALTVAEIQVLARLDNVEERLAVSEDRLTEAEGVSLGHLELSGGAMTGPISNLRTDDNAVHIGDEAGLTNQSSNSIAIGNWAGRSNQQGLSVAVGDSSAFSGQGSFATAIGNAAGSLNQGDYTVAVGSRAGYTAQHDNTIIINADSAALNSTGANQIRIAAGTTTLDIDATNMTMNGNPVYSSRQYMKRWYEVSQSVPGLGSLDGVKYPYSGSIIGDITYNNGTGEFTIPKAGVYMVRTDIYVQNWGFQAWYNTNLNDRRCGEETSQATGGDESRSLVTIAYFTANTTFKVKVANLEATSQDLFAGVGDSENRCIEIIRVWGDN